MLRRLVLAAALALLAAPPARAAETLLGGYQFQLESLDSVLDPRGPGNLATEINGLNSSWTVHNFTLETSLITDLLVGMAAALVDMTPHERQRFSVDGQDYQRKRELDIFGDDIKAGLGVLSYIRYGFGQTTSLTYLTPSGSVTPTDPAQTWHFSFGLPFWQFDLGFPVAIGGEVSSVRFALPSAGGVTAKNLDAAYATGWIRSVLGWSWLHLDPSVGYALQLKGLLPYNKLSLGGELVFAPLPWLQAVAGYGLQTGGSSMATTPDSDAEVEVSSLRAQTFSLGLRAGF